VAHAGEPVPPGTDAASVLPWQERVPVEEEGTLNFVALLTSGPFAGEDNVLEVGAVKLKGTEELGHFAQLAFAGFLPLAVKKLTGLDEARLRGHPTAYEVMGELLDYVSDGPTVVHGTAAFCAFTEAEGLKPPDVLLDSVLLARLVMPDALDYSLPALAEALELELPRYRRALSDAMLTAQVWRRLLDKARELPEAVLAAACRICKAAAEPLLQPLERIANEKPGFAQAARAPSMNTVMPDHRELFRQAQQCESPEPANAPLPTEKMCDMFAVGGLVARKLPNYEQRPEQVEMLRELCEAFNEGRHLVIEAGTGTGKSMAYLVPAIAWARQNEDKVVISTNTKNLQDQLYNKDLPFLKELFQGRFSAALLKGRENYLCVRRFLHLVENFERELTEPEEMRALLPVVSWAASTHTGDLSECTGLMVDLKAPSLLPALTCGPGECAEQACRSRNACFVRKARALAQLADVIVVNHALLFSDLALDQPILPIYRCLIFDEAHNLEDAATNALAVSVDSLSIFRITNRLFRKRKDGAGSGMLATVLYELRKHSSEGEAAECEKAKELVPWIITDIDRVVEATYQFFELLGAPFAELPEYEERLPLDECRPPVGPESQSWQAAQRLRHTILALNKSTEALARQLERNADRIKGALELANDLRAQTTQLKEVADQILFILSQQEADHVYWLERTTRDVRTFYSIHAAPLDIGKYMRSYFLEGKRCAVFTSATLKVNGNFRYILQRLGAEELSPERIRCVALGSSFDYDAQARVCIPTFLPDPGGQRNALFDQELAAFLIELLEATRGRALVLFTSYSLLNAIYDAVKRPLEKAGILVLAQGRDGSRETITRLFRSVTSSVLLGTQSFWEGVDIAGESLSCLLITKLPFHVITDPLIKGRARYLRSRGLDPFRHYTLPEAVISFRQGFGRLIRTKTDRGIIVVTDRRLATKAYGRTFLASLPTRPRIFRDKETLIQTVKRFLA